MFPNHHASVRRLEARVIENGLRMKQLKKIIKIETPAEAKFPQSKELFRFVKRVIVRALDIDDSERLNDIEIGKMVGYGYEETSRWKHGRIKVDGAEKLMAMHENLGIDEYLLLRVASGRMDAEQAYALWEVGYDLKRKYGKEKLAAYLRSRNIEYNLVIVTPEEGEGD